MKIDKRSHFIFSDLQLSGGSRDLKMLWVSPGTFLMGSPEDEEGHAYEDGKPFLATLSHGFWLGQYPITQAQWMVVMSNNPSSFHGENHPVENVSWNDAVEYCDKLNNKYNHLLPLGYKFNLPTQMQWEFACRAGSQNLFSKGDDLDDLLSLAWCRENSNGMTHAVREKSPNRWGFYDMLGNVLEWCYDAGEDYPVDSASDWIGNQVLSIRILRGGAWSLGCSPINIRCSISYFESPSKKESSIGFRLCLRSS
jgi:formylglycine-generating enzyme required for sulfatase activity